MALKGGFGAATSIPTDSARSMLSAVGLIRPSRRRGFCPACRFLQTGDVPQEIAAPALIALAFLVVAALVWVLTIVRMSSMDYMAMGLGSIDAFIASWLPTGAVAVFAYAMANSEQPLPRSEPDRR